MSVIERRLYDTERRLQLWQETSRSFMFDAEFWRLRAEALQSYISSNGWDLPDFIIATNSEPPYTDEEQNLQELRARGKTTNQKETRDKPW